jgi:hypothetical protein
MISFKEFWVLLENKQYMYSWMAPNGNIYPNLDDDIHSDTATKLIIAFNLSSNTKRVYDIMYNAGWMRIQYQGSTLYCNNSKMVPNDKQKRSLLRLAEQNRMRSIVFDNEKTERTIWSSEDF